VQQICPKVTIVTIKINISRGATTEGGVGYESAFLPVACGRDIAPIINHFLIQSATINIHHANNAFK
jgi:hypothetical protein